jgi:hypothetical protein
MIKEESEEDSALLGEGIGNEEAAARIEESCPDTTGVV